MGQALQARTAPTRRSPRHRADDRSADRRQEVQNVVHAGAIHPMKAAAQGRQHLIPIRAGRCGDIVRGKMRAKNLQPASGLHGGMIGHVECGQVHGDAAYQRDGGAVKARRSAAGQTSVKSIGIAQRRGRDPAGPRGGPGGIVADGGARRDVADRAAPGPTAGPRARIGLGWPGVGLMP